MIIIESANQSERVGKSCKQEIKRSVTRKKWVKNHVLGKSHRYTSASSPRFGSTSKGEANGAKRWTKDVTNAWKRLGAVATISRSAYLEVGAREHGEDVEPPLGLFARRALEEVDAVGGRQRQAERVARHLLGLRHLHDAVHVDARLRHRLRLVWSNNKKKTRKKWVKSCFSPGFHSILNKYPFPFFKELFFNFAKFSFLQSCLRHRLRLVWSNNKKKRGKTNQVLFLSRILFHFKLLSVFFFKKEWCISTLLSLAFFDHACGTVFGRCAPTKHKR